MTSKEALWELVKATCGEKLEIDYMNNCLHIIENDLEVLEILKKMFRVSKTFSGNTIIDFVGEEHLCIYEDTKLSEETKKIKEWLENDK